MNLLKFLHHCCRNKITYPAEQLHSTVEDLWTSCILATTAGAHTQEHLRTASLWLSRLLSGSADPLTKLCLADSLLRLVLCTSLCSAQIWVISHDSKNHRYCFQLAQTHCSAALLYPSPHSELLCKRFQRQQSQPWLPCILSELNSFAIPHLPP